VRFPDLRFAARLYCATAGAVLIALGLSAWDADRAKPIIGALLAGAGLFLIAGCFGRPTRLTAMLALCALCFGGAFLAGLGHLLLALQVPAGSIVRLLLIELAATLVAARLARSLYLESTSGSR
jgi:hypothetical protein